MDRPVASERIAISPPQVSPIRRELRRFRLRCYVIMTLQGEDPGRLLEKNGRTIRPWSLSVGRMHQAPLSIGPGEVAR